MLQLPSGGCNSQVLHPGLERVCPGRLFRLEVPLEVVERENEALPVRHAANRLGQGLPHLLRLEDAHRTVLGIGDGVAERERGVEGDVRAYALHTLHSSCSTRTVPVPRTAMHAAPR